MNKHKQELPVTETNSLSDFLSDNEIVKWIGDNGRTLLWIFLALLAIAFILLKLFGGSAAKLENGYFKAQSDLTTLASGASDPAAQEKALKQLAAFTEQYPSLQSKYDGLIAQLLLNQNQAKEALPFVKRTLARTGKDHLPFYADYANATLLISQENYSEALKEAQHLKQQMISQAKEKGGEKEFGDTLYLFNLLRIAMLHQQLNHHDEELAAWQEFKQSAIESQSQNYFVQSDLFEQFSDKLKDGQASLLNYIEAREKLLKQD